MCWQDTYLPGQWYYLKLNATNLCKLLKRIWTIPSSDPYSSPRLVVDRMDELIVELLFLEKVWCQKKSWLFMNLLCSGMVGFGLRRNLGTAEKEHPSPLFPLRWSEMYWSSSSVKVKGSICLRSDWCRTTVPLRPSEGEEGGRGALFQLSPNFAID